MTCAPSSQLNAEPKTTYTLIVFGHLTHDVIITPEGVHEALGGVATYTSLAAARLGATVGVVAKVGSDFKREYLEYLRKGRIDLSGFKMVNGKTTVFENIYDAQGVRTQRAPIITEPIEVKDIPAPYFNAKCFHFGPVFHEVSYEVIKLAHRKGIMTSLDPQGYCRKRRPDHVIELREWMDAEEVLPYIDILKCDETEAERLTGISALSKAAELISRLGPKIVLVTQGGKGSILYYDNKLKKIPTIPAEKVVDTTGAGDSYAAGFIVEYLRTQDPEHSALFAASVASFVVEGVGATTLPTREMSINRLNKFLKRVSASNPRETLE